MEENLNVIGVKEDSVKEEEETKTLDEKERIIQYDKTLGYWLYLERIIVVMGKKQNLKKKYYKNIEDGNKIEEIEKKVREEFEEFDGVILDENNESYYQ